MKELKRITSIGLAANFGKEVNGRVSRVISVNWSSEDTDIMFVGDATDYQGNLVLPDKFNENQLDAFKQEVHNAIDAGTLHVYGYEFPVELVSEYKFNALKNPLKPDRAPMQVFRRAWPRPDAEKELLIIIRAQLAKSIAKGSLVGTTV